MSISAVITADIVNSTKLSKLQGKKLSDNLVAVLENQKYEFYRGDSFQVYLKSPSEALSVTLQLRTIAMKVLLKTSVPIIDIRASIGLGTVDGAVKTLKTASGEAFILSGRAFDKIDNEQRLVICCNEKYKAAAVAFDITAYFLDYLFQRLTFKQAAVVSELLMNRTQTEAARRLKKSQATINKHTRSAGWPQIDKLLAQYKALVNLIEA